MTDRPINVIAALIDGKRVGMQSAGEAEHFIKCGNCGSWIDMRRLDQVLAHEMPNHTAEMVQ